MSLTNSLMTTVVLCPPAARVMLVQVFGDDLGDGNIADEPFIMPVLAIMACPDPEGGVKLEPIVLSDPVWGFATGTEAECSNAVQRLVACPWPVEKEEEQLALVIRELTDQLRRQALPLDPARN